jgi:hypothetical protein
MSSREKDQADFDLERFVELFDECMTSTNPAVQKAFKNLLLVASIANSDTKTNPVTQGPLRRLVEDLQHINRRLRHVENSIIQKEEIVSTRQSDIEAMIAKTKPLLPVNSMYKSPQDR